GLQARAVEPPGGDLRMRGGYLHIPVTTTFRPSPSAPTCPIDPARIGVPFLTTENNCAARRTGARPCAGAVPSKTGPGRLPGGQSPDTAIVRPVSGGGRELVRRGECREGSVPSTRAFVRLRSSNIVDDDVDTEIAGIE